MRLNVKWLFTGLALAVLAAWAWRHSRQDVWPVVNAERLAAGTDRTVLCFGDSLVAGTGTLPGEPGYPEQLAQRLGCEVRSAGFPGATAADGLARLRAAPDLSAGLVIVTLGGNDLLQQVPWAETERGLRAVFREFQSRGAVVAFTGVEFPLFGGDLRGRQRRLCRECGVLFIPNILGGILTDSALRADQVHPNRVGYGKVAERVAARVRKLTGSAVAGGG